MGGGYNKLRFLSFDCIYRPRLCQVLQADRMYPGWPRDLTSGLGFNMGGGGFGFLLFLGRGFDFKGGSFEPLEPPLATGMALQVYFPV